MVHVDPWLQLDNKFYVFQQILIFHSTLEHKLNNNNNNKTICLLTRKN